MKKEKIVSENSSEVSSAADEIWNDIKNLDINMFALPNQKVNDYCVPIMVEPSKLYLKVKTSSFIRILEDTISNKYNVVFDSAYLTVSKKV